MDDRELLRDYAERRSQDAFRELVERHLPMVYSAARRIVHDAHLAEEVAQNVFTTLAKKAKLIQQPQVVGGWLYNTTRHLSFNTVRGEQRRREREQTALAMQTLDLVPDDPRLTEYLEPAMSELDAEDRDTLVLRYLENRTLREVGAELGISEDAARMRVNRALERLRAGFAHYGVTASAMILATAMTSSANPLPSGLAATIATSAFAAAQTGLMVAAKLVGGLAIVGAFVLGIAFLSRPLAGGGSDPALPPPSNSPTPADFLEPPARAGLRGQILLAGTPPAERIIPMDAACGRTHSAPVTTRTYVVGTNGGLADVLVYIKAGAPMNFNYQPPSVLLENSNCLFEPYVFAVLTNQPIIIRNSDAMLHNVHALMKRNREFNVGLPAKFMTVTKSFPLPEMFASLKCDVHPWMFSYVCVLDHPWFAVSDRDGNFQFPLPLPPGTYTIAASHRRAGEVTQTMVVISGQTNEAVKLTLTAK
jgi:RNA polymerase sigma factor (sigma-70 family)